VNSAALALTILLESQAPTLELFLLSRFLLGVTVGGCGVISYVWGTEWANYHVQLSPPEFETGTAIDKVRAAAVGGTIFQILWSIGGVVLPLLAWMVPFWRTSLLIICIATAVGGTVVLLAVPESPKWLQSKHRTYQLTKLDSMIRQFNSARLSRREWRRLSDDDAVAVDYCGDDTSKIRGKDDDELASVAEEFSIEIEAEEKPIDEENDERPTDKTFAIRQALLPLRQLLSRRMLPTTIAFAVLWFANAFLYYGLVLNVNRLPGNVYVLSSLMSLLCIPGQLLSVTASKRLGVRRALIWGMAIVGGLFGMLAMLTVFSLSLGSGADWLPLLSIAISLVGQFIVNMTFTLCYRITAQTFPTAIRSTAVGLCVMAGRVGAMLCPVVVLLGSDSTHSSGGGSMGVAGLSILALVSCLATATFSRFASDSAPSAGD
jgi:MFS family permease